MIDYKFEDINKFRPAGGRTYMGADVTYTITSKGNENKAIRVRVISDLCKRIGLKHGDRACILVDKINGVMRIIKDPTGSSRLSANSKGSLSLCIQQKYFDGMPWVDERVDCDIISEGPGFVDVAFPDTVRYQQSPIKSWRSM